MMPITTVALRLTSFPAPTSMRPIGTGCPSSSSSKNSSVLSVELFQPQLWEIANVSGPLENLVTDAPVALAHEIEK